MVVDLAAGLSLEAFCSDATIERGSVVVGSAATVRDKLAEDIQALGLNYMVTAFYFGDIPHQLAMHSMQTFAADIMPALEGL